MDVLDTLVCPTTAYMQAESNWQETRQRRVEELDPGMVPLLDRINRLPGLTSTYSCEGHPERNQAGRRRHVRLWIRFVGDREGVSQALALYDRIRHHPLYLSDRDLRRASRLVLVTEQIPFPTGEHVSVPGFIISLPAMHPQLKSDSWIVLNDSILAMLGEGS